VVSVGVSSRPLLSEGVYLVLQLVEDELDDKKISIDNLDERNEAPSVLEEWFSHIHM
jgi:hypothetical protein